MGFDSKRDIALPTILLGHLICLEDKVSFFSPCGIQNSPVDGCSSASCNLEFLQDETSACPSTLPSSLVAGKD